MGNDRTTSDRRAEAIRAAVKQFRAEQKRAIATRKRGLRKLERGIAKLAVRVEGSADRTRQLRNAERTRKRLMEACAALDARAHQLLALADRALAIPRR